MSLFRKPKKIQRRMFCADDDEDGEPEAPPPPIISREKKENKPVKTVALLSFADEDEEEEFKVKKSSQSKKLIKKREKEKRKAVDGDIKQSDFTEETNNHTEPNDKAKPKKKVTLEGLILSGREALAADGTGDISDDEGNDEDEEEEDDSRGFHRYRAESVRAALAIAPGHIPDAALIHAARKTRQQARELGGDFIPVHSEAKPGSRLIRDDDDGSGDDEDEEGRLHVRGLDLPSDKPKRGTEAASNNEELDSEAEEWAEQQMQKAMPAIIDIGERECMSDVNPFSLAPRAAPPGLVPSAPGAPAIPAHLRPLPAAASLTTADQLVDALRTRLEELKKERQKTADQNSECHDRLLAASRIREQRHARRSELDAAYRRSQAARGYLTDLIECLDEKMVDLESLEGRALAMHRRRCEFLVERRRADLRDQAQDVLALAARAGAARPVDSEQKVRRAAEREGRRRARRLRREAAGVLHRDGDSSDDELPPAELSHFQQERKVILRQSEALFADALPAWRGVRGVCSRLARIRRAHPALYADAYLPDCLPKLIAPYVRHQLILWNPLADEDNEDYERMDWYKCLMMYGVRSERLSNDSEDSWDEDQDDDQPAKVTEHSVREDTDLNLVPAIVTKVIIPKITELVEHAWDPMMVRACVRLRQLLERVSVQPGSAAATRRLAAAVRLRLESAVHADVFLPTLPPHILEGPGRSFWRRCVGSGVRLLRAALALTAPPRQLHADPVVLALIDTLCTAAGAATGPAMASAAAALADTLPRNARLRAPALTRIAALAQLALTRLHSDDPLHMKALEQVRNIIAEAKNVEALIT